MKDGSILGKRHWTWDFLEFFFPKVYRRHSKSLQLKRLRSLKNIKSRRRLVISSPADILCRSLWRERLRQSRLYLEWWRQAYRWEQPAGEKTGEGRGGGLLRLHKLNLHISKTEKNSLNPVSNNRCYSSTVIIAIHSYPTTNEWVFNWLYRAVLLLLLWFNSHEVLKSF